MAELIISSRDCQDDQIKAAVTVGTLTTPQAVCYMETYSETHRRSAREGLSMQKDHADSLGIVVSIPYRFLICNNIFL